MPASTSICRRELLAAVGGATALGWGLGPSCAPNTPLLPARAGIPPAPLAPAAESDYLFAKGLIYLNTAALGPTPRPVIEKTIQAWYDLEANPSLHGYKRLKDAMEGVRAQAAKFVGCAKDEMVITQGTTDGMNTVAQGLGLTSGQHVLTSDQEHPGGQMCWKHYARRHGVIIDTVPIPAGENDARRIVDRFAAAITRDTRVISVSHVLSSTGLRMPIAELAALARAHGCLCVVDGAQAVGAIDVNVKSLGCHAYATSGHKWLLGPKGTGLLYLSDESAKIIEPLVLEDGRGVYVESVGVRNIPGVLGLGAAMDHLTAIGLPAVEAHAVALRNRLYAGLKQIPRLTVVSPPPGPLATPLVTFSLPHPIESGTFVTMLRDKHHFVVKMVPKNWLNGIRISTHIFNTDKEVDLLLHVLRTELA